LPSKIFATTARIHTVTVKKRTCVDNRERTSVTVNQNRSLQLKQLHVCILKTCELRAK